MAAKMTQALETGNLSRRGIIAMLLLSAAMVVGMAVLSYQSTRQLEAATRERETSGDIRDATEDLLSQLKDAETGQRGYLLTGKDEYLEPYHTALSRIPADLDYSRLWNLQPPRPPYRDEFLKRNCRLPICFLSGEMAK